MSGDELRRLVRTIAARLDGEAGSGEQAIGSALKALEEAGLPIGEGAGQELRRLRLRRLDDGPEGARSPAGSQTHAGVLGLEPDELVYRVRELGSLVMGLLSAGPFESGLPQPRARFKLVDGEAIVSSLDVAALVVFVVALCGWLSQHQPRGTEQAAESARLPTAPLFSGERYVVFAVPASLADGLLRALEANDHQTNEEIAGLLAESCRWIGLQPALPEFQAEAARREASVHDLLVLMTDGRMTIPRGFEKDASGLARRDAFKALGRNGVKLRVLSQRLPQEELARDGFFALA